MIQPLICENDDGIPQDTIEILVYKLVWFPMDTGPVLFEENAQTVEQGRITKQLKKRHKCTVPPLALWGIMLIQYVQCTMVLCATDHLNKVVLKNKNQLIFEEQKSYTEIRKVYLLEKKMVQRKSSEQLTKALARKIFKTILIRLYYVTIFPVWIGILSGRPSIHGSGSALPTVARSSFIIRFIIYATLLQ